MTTEVARRAGIVGHAILILVYLLMALSLLALDFYKQIRGPDGNVFPQIHFRGELIISQLIFALMAASSLGQPTVGRKFLWLLPTFLVWGGSMILASEANPHDASVGWVYIAAGIVVLIIGKTVAWVAAGRDVAK